MKTVFISIDWFHPAYKAGGPVQSIANLVEQYCHEQVNFKIFCSNTDFDGITNKGVPFDEWYQYNDFTQVWYAAKKTLSIHLIKRIINNTKPDLIFIIGIYSWYFNLVPLLFCHSPMKIISVRGMLHPGALSQKYFKKQIFLFFCRLYNFSYRYYFHATNIYEKSFIRQVYGNDSRVYIAGNFPREFQFQPILYKKTNYLKMVSIALISAMKNIELVLDSLKYCTRQVSYDIYGSIKEEKYWNNCLEKIKSLPANIKVNYYGGLNPLNVENRLQFYDLFILPSKSENFGHSILEALSAGKPVITSHFTPFNDLNNHYAGSNVSVDNIEEMASSINFFSSMPQEEFIKWNIGARKYAANRIDKESLHLQYDQMFLNNSPF